MNSKNHMKKAEEAFARDYGGGRDANATWEGPASSGPCKASGQPAFQNAFERWPRRSAALPETGALLLKKGH